MLTIEVNLLSVSKFKNVSWLFGKAISSGDAAKVASANRPAFTRMCYHFGLYFAGLSRLFNFY